MFPGMCHKNGYVCWSVYFQNSTVAKSQISIRVSNSQTEILVSKSQTGVHVSKSQTGILVSKSQTWVHVSKSQTGILVSQSQTGKSILVCSKPSQWPKWSNCNRGPKWGQMQRVGPKCANLPKRKKGFTDMSRPWKNTFTW
jgi:hypothetical protein